MRVNAGNDGRGPGRLQIRADDPALTPYAGLAIVGELARSTRLVELIDAELGAVAGAAAVKTRRRGLTAGELVVSLAECQIAGAECFDDVENVRADTAGRAVIADYVFGAPDLLQFTTGGTTEIDIGKRTYRRDGLDQPWSGQRTDAAVAWPSPYFRQLWGPATSARVVGTGVVDGKIQAHVVVVDT